MSKLKKVQIFRIAIQILMLFLLPGLFIMAFNELKEILKMIISGNMNLFQALPSLLEFIAVTALTFIMGRFFCGWLCAFGTYNDLIYLASKKIFKTKFRMNENIDAYLKYVKYVILFTILVVSCILGSTIFSSASPWDAFAQISDFPNILISLPVGVLLLLFITIGAFFVERFFCRYLCPLGAFFTMVSRISFIKIRKPTEQCGKCRICTNNCSMGLKLYKTEYVHGGDCINCLKCIDACPRKNTCVNAFGQDANSALASSIAIAAVAGIYGVSSLGGYNVNQNSPDSSRSVVSGNVNDSAQKYRDGTYTGTGTSSSTVADNSSNDSANAPESTGSSNSEQSSTTSSSTAVQQGQYKDGTYTGTGIGFRGGSTTISVTVSGGKIIEIQTLSTRDTPRFYYHCESTITNDIILSQSTSVDTVSGATYSSNGIINAVKDALNKAV